MDDIGRLTRANGRYEFTFGELDLVVRGAHAEWVLEAATEIIARTARAEADGKLMELETLHDLGETDEIELEIVKQDAQDRFEQIPQCLVSLGTMDYRWISPAGRPRTADPELRQSMERVFDQSKTRTDSFLANVDGAFDRPPHE